MDVQYFLGANSAEGFFSHYDQLLPAKNRRLTRILKGGPGSGKSTLMKKVAARAEQLELRTERIPCSSDPDSLDGIVIPELGYAVVDGTAPHIVEPQLCGSGEAYLDLGAGYRLDALQSCRHALREIQQAGRACYPKATACLKAAAALEPLISGTASLTPSLAASICQKEIPDRTGTASLRTVFLSGHTPKGRLACWDTVAALCSRVYVLQDSAGAVNSFLRAIAKTASARGWACLIGDSPLQPGLFWEHLLIPDLELAFVSSSPLSLYPGRDGIALGQWSGDAPMYAMQQALIDEAISHLRRAKEFHDLLESVYFPCVDFSVADRAALDCCAELELLLDREKR